ncbi:MAG: serine/threonine protein phosphatase [Alphaproteobacteria bacterium]|nr:serine/threonine protein phosphatase [Alphaproteobacteria bacterium]
MLGWLFGNRQHTAHDLAPSFVPAGTIVYAIGDIHGRLDLLQQLEAKIERDAARVGAERQIIVCLGDYIDRGDNSYGVIEHLLNDPPTGFERFCLIGNHESYLLRFLEDTSLGAGWLANGGGETLSSYGVASPGKYNIEDRAAEVQDQLRDRLPEAHLAFLRALSLSHREGDYFFAHAGVKPGVSLESQDPHDLMWIREEFLAHKSDFGAVVVHGHSIKSEAENLANRIGVDTGAYASGRLTCAVLWASERRFLTT